MDAAAVYAIETLILARALARAYRNLELSDACAKSIEYVQDLSKRANGWASEFPRDEDEPEETEHA